MAIMVTVTFSQVVNRFVFGGSFFWAEECAILSMIWITFLGSTVAMANGTHTRIDFLINKLPKKARAVVESIDYIIIAIFLGALSYYTLPIIKSTSNQITVGMKISRSVMYYLILVGGAIMCFYCVLLAINSIIKIKGGQDA